jgi:hypothetical protein
MPKSPAMTAIVAVRREIMENPRDDDQAMLSIK